MAFGLPNSVSKVVPDSLGPLDSLTKNIPTEWGFIAIVVLALPLIGMFLVPGLRLGGAVMQGLAAVGSAAVMCVTAWSVLAIGYITALSSALQPRPGFQPYLRWIFIGAVGLVGYAFLPKITIPLWVISTAISIVALYCTYRVVIFLARRLVIPATWVPRIRVGLVCFGFLFVALQVGGSRGMFRFSSDSNVNSCLDQGKIDASCLRASGAEPF